MFSSRVSYQSSHQKIVNVGIPALKENLGERAKSSDNRSGGSEGVFVFCKFMEN